MHNAKIESNNMVQKIKSYAAADGKYWAWFLFTVTKNKWLCMNKPAIVGPIELPIILNKLLMPKEMPICWYELFTIMILVLLTFVKESPIDRITKNTDMKNSFTLINKSKENPNDIAIVPICSGVVCPILVMINPVKGPKIKSTKAKGNCTIDICNAFSSKPNGYGL